jgi:hypothetical protein
VRKYKFIDRTLDRAPGFWRAAYEYVGSRDPSPLWKMFYALMKKRRAETKDS